MVRDLRHALHTLRRSPGYAALSIAVLALGIGANAAIFSVLDSVVLHALPYPDPDRLVYVWQRFPAMPPPMGPRMFVARENFKEWQRRNTSFSAMAGHCTRSLNETSTGHTEVVSTGFASPELFPLLGAKPAIGRSFNTGEHTVVLSDEFFDRRFQRNAAALGRMLTIDGTAYTIVGVLPPKFHLPSTHEGSDQMKADVWVPLSNLPEAIDQDHNLELQVIARLKPGVTVAQARQQMIALMEQLKKEDPKSNEGWTASLFSVREEDTEPSVHLALYVLMAAVGFLLLIACANLANLTLARATLRSREVAVRLALGATRAQLVSQLIAEPFLLSIAGAALGLLFAGWCVRLMVAYKPEDIHRVELISINLPVLLFAAAAGVVTTILFGLAPALSASRGDLNTALRSGGAGGSSAARLRSRQFLIALEVALALVLVTGAGLMIRSFQELMAVGVGFRTDRVAVADVELPRARYRDDASRARFFRDLLARASAAPGVNGAAIVDHLPLHQISMSNFFIEGRPEPALSELPIADKDRSDPGYFALLGLRIEEGRGFTEADEALTEKGANGVAIVNRAFAKQFFPNENPIGHRLLGPDHKNPCEIVGVVSDFRPMGVEGGARSTIFWPDLRLESATLVLRSSVAPGALAATVRNLVWGIDKELPAPELRPMQYYVDEWLSQRKFNTFLLGLFAALALILGMLGIYGVLATLVASRVREIGIRMAIGAAPAQIGKLVLGQSMIPVAVGVVAGLGASLVLGRFLETLLFNVKPRDPVTLAAAVVAIVAVSPVAIYVPLRRATRVDCTVALREE